MNREAFESRIQELLDRRQSPAGDPELLRAAEAAPELRRLLNAYQMFGSLRRPRPLPPANLAERVLSEMRAKPARVERRTPAWLAPFVAVAATLLIATTISIFADKHAAPTAGPAAPRTANVADPKPSASPRWNRLSQQAAANYRELAATTGQSLNSALSIVRPPAPVTTAEKETPANVDDRWLRGVPGGLRPLSDSTSGAVYSLMRVVPSGDDSDREQF